MIRNDVKEDFEDYLKKKYPERKEEDRMIDILKEIRRVDDKLIAIDAQVSGFANVFDIDIETVALSINNDAGKKIAIQLKDEKGVSMHILSNGKIINLRSPWNKFKLWAKRFFAVND